MRADRLAPLALIALLLGAPGAAAAKRKPAAKPRYAAAVASPTAPAPAFSLTDRRGSRTRFRVCVTSPTRAVACRSGRTPARRGRKGSVRVPLGAATGTHVARFAVRGRTVATVRFARLEAPPNPSPGGPPPPAPGPAPAPEAPTPTPAPAAPGAKPPVLLATKATTGCPGATTWRIGYRLYRQDSDGGTVTDAKIRHVVDAQQVWADRVADLGQCAVRVVVDLYDMQDAVARPADFQPWEASFRDRGDYDVLFDLVPQPRVAPPWVEKTNGAQAVFLDVSANPSLPSQDVHLHAWLHSVEIFYVWVDLPPGGVHGYAGGRNPGYSNADTDAYYRDLMRGAVPKPGSPGQCLGMLAPYWARYGTPRHWTGSQVFATGHACP